MQRPAWAAQAGGPDPASGRAVESGTGALSNRNFGKELAKRIVATEEGMPC